MTISRGLLAGASALALMVGTAQAADLMIYEQPAPVVAYGHDDSGMYLGVFGGAVWANAEADDGSAAFGQFFDFDTDIGWTAGLVAGAHITNMLRGEVEVSTGLSALTGVTITGGPDPYDDDSYPITDGTLSTTYLLGNLWFDLDTGSGFTPYLGGGVGAAYVMANGDLPVGDVDLSGWGLAYQVGAGVKVDVAENVALDLGYRYKAVVDAELEGGGDDAIANIGSHVVQAGLTIGF